MRTSPDEKRPERCHAAGLSNQVCTAENSNHGLTSQAKWAARNPKATWAHACLRSALKRGLLQRAPCEVCGSPDVDGHHDNYDRPMDVSWLCRRHHKAHHAGTLVCEAIE